MLFPDVTYRWSKALPLLSERVAPIRQSVHGAAVAVRRVSCAAVPPQTYLCKTCLYLGEVSHDTYQGLQPFIPSLDPHGDSLLPLQRAQLLLWKHGQ